jgi:beta-glucanase (GH16 family)
MNYFFPENIGKLKFFVGKYKIMTKIFPFWLALVFSVIGYSQTNLISNSGFESGSSAGIWGGSSVVNNNQRSGSYALQVVESTATGGGFEYSVSGLLPRTTYQFEAWIKTDSNGPASLGAKDFGGANVQTSLTDNSEEYTLVKVRFTTGVYATSAVLNIDNPKDGNGVFYADDLSLTKINFAYDLVWADEFNGTGSFDSTKWVSEVGFKRNKEEQYYHADNSIVSNGNLVITAKRETNFVNPEYNPLLNNWRMKRQYADWTSGSLITKGKIDFLYGRFEIRAKVTNLEGTWPAIWTVGSNSECSWPSNGEIDIMENYTGGILGNFAVANSGLYRAKWDAIKIPISDLGVNWEDEYHIWTLDWHEDRMAIYVDDFFVNDIDLNSAASFNSNESDTCPGDNPFRMPQFLRLNLAIGGNSGGDSSGLGDTTEYLVDYVRVYQINPNNNSANLIDDPGFETGTSTNIWGGSSIVSNNVYAGTYAARLEENSQWGGGYEQVVAGLSPNTTYDFSAYVRSSGGEGASIGVKDYAGDATSGVPFTNTSYEQISLSFTTGSNNTTAKIFIYNEAGGAETLYADDLELVEKTMLSLESEEKDLFKVYPNPVHTILNIELTNTQEGQSSYSIVNVRGQLLLKGSLKKLTTVDVSGLETGLYFLHINNLNKVESHKIIVK